MSKIVKKICLIGPEGVGKTSMIRRYVDSSFEEKYISTIGVSLSNKIISLSTDQLLELVLWDLEGFTSKGLHFPTSYLNGASGFVFVSDVTDEKSLESTQKICLELYQKFENKFCFSLALNKADLLSKAQDYEALEAYARDKFSSCQPKNIFLTSAKIDKNVGALFENLGEDLVKYNIPNFRA